jgi:hypothetical protein
MFAGKLKAFSSLSNWYSELRLYRRDKEGRLVKENDHAMDAMRYLVMSGVDRAKTKPVKKPQHMHEFRQMPGEADSQWMA